MSGSTTGRNRLRALRGAWGGCLLACASLASAAAVAADPCGPARCDVTAFGAAPDHARGETDDARLQAALAAARGTPHGTVFLPDGTYRISEPVQVREEVAKLALVGQSRAGTILEVAAGGRIGSAVNIDRAGGFAELDVAIRNLTIDYGEPGHTPSGHGIRVGNGWKRGRLLIDNVAILSAPGYGIGIQNARERDIAADNVTIRDVYIRDAGSDGIDTKLSPTGNAHLVIDGIVVENVGLADARSAAAIDISYDHFSVEDARISVTPCLRTPQSVERQLSECTAARADPAQSAAEAEAICGREPRSCNVGIRLRERRNAASHGVIRDVQIDGALFGIFFEGKTDLNRDVVIDGFVLRGFSSAGIYLRGAGHRLSNGCAYAPSDARARGREIHFGGPSDRRSIRIDRRTVGTSEAFCPLLH